MNRTIPHLLYCQPCLSVFPYRLGSCESRLFPRISFQYSRAQTGRISPVFCGFHSKNVFFRFAYFKKIVLNFGVICPVGPPI